MADKTLSRDEALAEFLRRTPITTLLMNIEDLGIQSRDLEEIRGEIDAAWLDVLWPDDDPEDDPEFEEAQAETALRAAHLLYAVAASADRFAREARRISALAEEKREKARKLREVHDA